MVPWRPVFPVSPTAPAEAGMRQTVPHHLRGDSLDMHRSYCSAHVQRGSPVVPWRPVFPVSPVAPAEAAAIRPLS